MKTFKINLVEDFKYDKLIAALQSLADEGIIVFEETNENEPEPATEDQVQEIIEESELGPYYTEKEAKDILNL
ncbi:hypothetical protein [Dyadobacter sp. 32]|uniref:hypothetical protein n=1 Tax=Dyadobacter sp. 32 TaxID=538966 RepID=UPI0011EEA548